MRLIRKLILSSHISKCDTKISQDKKDAEAIELVERLARTEQELRQKEAELKEIRIAEERDERENAFRVEELETRVIELEGAIKERDAARQSKDGMNLAGAGDEDGGEGESKTKSQDDEMSAMKHALEECQKELAAHKARAEVCGCAFMWN